MTQQEAIARVAQRYGLPVEAVAEIATADPLVLITRSTESETIPNNGAAPQPFTQYPPGSVRVAPYGGDIENRYIDYLRVFDPKDLVNAEAEEDIRRHPTYARYLAWSRQGIEAPYISVYQTEQGRLQSTNRRRTLVAQELGLPVTGWFGPYNAETGLPLKYGDVVEAIRAERVLDDRIPVANAPLRRPSAGLGF